MTDTNKSKVITLPLTCKQILWIIIPTFHFIGILGILIGIFDYENKIWILLVVMGWSFPMAYWIIKIIDMGVEGKLPQFKCKCESANTSEQKE